MWLATVSRCNSTSVRQTRSWECRSISPDVKNIFDFQYEDFELENYDPWPHIKADVSV